VRASRTSFPLSKHTGGGDIAPAFSGLHVYLQLTRDVGLPPLFCGVFLPPWLLQAFPLLIAGQYYCSCQLPCLFTAHMGGRSSPPPVEFFSFHHSYKLSCSWLLGAHPRSHKSLSGLPQLVYLQFWEGFPSPNLRCSVQPTLFPMCLYCSYCLLLSFSYFPGWGSVCPGGYADLAQGCLWEYCSTAKLILSVFSQAIWEQMTGSLGTLLVSPFNVNWRCSARSGGGEGVNVLTLLGGFPCKVCLQRLSKI
jgi:hypothetical protein